MKKIIQRISLALFSIIIFLVILEIGLRFYGFIVLYPQRRENTIAQQEHKGTFRILCLGESTTAMGGADSYPSQLQKILNQRNIGVKFSVLNRARGGMSTSDIVTEFDNLPVSIKPDMVLVMMGINDHIDYMAYQKFQHDQAGSFWMKFRVYRLANLLWLRYQVRIKGMGLLRKVKAHPAIVDKEPKDDSNFYLASARDYHGQNKELESEEAYKRALELNPNSDAAYSGLGWSLRGQKKNDEAERSFLQALKLNPKNSFACLGLGWNYWDQAKYSQAEEAFRRTLELDPANSQAFCGLGYVYKDQAKYSQAEEAFKKALELSPENDQIYVGLGWCYKQEGKFLLSKEAFIKAIGINPRNDEAYSGLGWTNWALGLKEEYKGAFKQALDLKPQRDWAYLEISFLLRNEGRYKDAEELLKKTIKENPNSDLSYGSLATIYTEIGDHAMAQRCYDQANQIRLECYNPVTVRNYLLLKKMLDKKGIKMVCIQYPVRSVESLKKMLAGDRQGVIFVDNERIFKDAIKKMKYSDYFGDMFGGDFGHCTPRGNKLLAENIAATILKEYFSPLRKISSK